MANLNFQLVTPVFKYVLLISMLKTIVLLNIFVESMIHFFAGLFQKDIYTAVQKFGLSKIFYVFLMESLMLIKAVFIWSKIQQKKSNIVKYYCNF